MTVRGKANRTGRTERGEHFAPMTRSLMEEPAWRALSSSAQALYPWLRLEWRGPQANNNGQIRLSVRQAADKMGVGINTAARAFHDLQAKGFLVVTEHARLGLSGEAKAPAYELTELGLPHASERGGRRLYRDWRSGHDFPVHKAMANNPTGRRTRAKPCHRDGDGTVIELVTKSRSTSPK
ncbi:hypothetical protein Rumeso_02634 [Rubellimicrobium mesophilum DSM 19309]|uniref:Uncharacterized protein n=1 Tax=Rubellimicrobium mesophilum DSM 19309 TaxID=442562 RepID=A0A017HMY6_9RHOB|nr:hypothetical protein [Rubellimicrobium mesophilum]EYD75852.1 hypothetical protein Rumeso_02634 [Rubellimicrobium mesophilum DSM 19309]